MPSHQPPAAKISEQSEETFLIGFPLRGEGKQIPCGNLLDEVESFPLTLQRQNTSQNTSSVTLVKISEQSEEIFLTASPQGEAFGLRCRYGSWSPVGTVQDRSSLSLRSVMDACHRHASPEMAVENGAGHVPPARSAAFPAESTGLLPARTK